MTIEIFTGILVLITAIYAWVTYQILRANQGVLCEMQLQQEALQRPYVSVAPVAYPESHIFYLQIKNTGKTGANNMRLSIDKDYYQFGEKKEGNNLRNLRAFSSPINSFAPGAEITFYLGSGFKILGKDADEDLTPSVFTVTTTYEFGNKTVEEKSVIDLNPYTNSVIPHDPIVSELTEIKKAISKKAS